MARGGGGGVFLIDLAELKGGSPGRRGSPRVLGEYSVDPEGNFYDDGRRKRYYVGPPDPGHVAIDIYKGEQSLVPAVHRVAASGDDGFEVLLRWIQQHYADLKDNRPDRSEETDRLRADVACRRTLLKNLLAAPYDRQPFRLLACRFRGTLYLRWAVVQEHQDYVQGRDKNMQGGARLTLLLTADSPKGKPNPDLSLDHMGCYFRVFGMTYGRDRQQIMYCSAVEAVDRKDQCTEVRTVNKGFWEQPVRGLFPLLKWWASASVAGAETIMVGVHGETDRGGREGLVTRIVQEPVAAIPQMNYKYAWTPGVCYKFLDQFLTHMQRVVATDDPREVYIFEKGKDSKVITHKRAPAGGERVLPDWYMDWEEW